MVLSIRLLDLLELFAWIPREIQMNCEACSGRHGIESRLSYCSQNTERPVQLTIFYILYSAT